MNDNNNISKEIYSNFKMFTYSNGKLSQVEKKFYKKKAVYFLNFSNLDTIVFELDNKKYEISNPLKYFISETIEIDLVKFVTLNNCLKINYNIDDDLNFSSFFIPYKCNEFSIIKFSNSELYLNFYKNKRLVKKYFIFYEFIYEKARASF
jgi:hypothetical protein